MHLENSFLENKKLENKRNSAQKFLFFSSFSQHEKHSSECGMLFRDNIIMLDTNILPNLSFLQRLIIWISLVEAVKYDR